MSDKTISPESLGAAYLEGVSHLNKLYTLHSTEVTHLYQLHHNHRHCFYKLDK